MSYLILKEECIDCRLCIPECPDKGISRNEVTAEYTIDKDSCTECIELQYSQCADICPVDCIIIDKNNLETKEQLILKLNKNKEKRKK